jgi:hypothetical protein
MVSVALVGGPVGLGQVFRCADVAVPERLVVDHYGQNAHFVRTDEVTEVDGRELSVYQWSYNTKIAE